MTDKPFSAEFVTEAVKGTPPVAVTVAAIGGMGITDWVAVLTGIYVAVQLAYLIWKWHREARAKASG